MSGEVYVLVNGELVAKSRDGVITEEYSRLYGVKKSDPYAGYGSDYLPGGVNGILNHADGKRYDSKSQYERAVKAKGCHVVGNDWNNAKLPSTPIERGIRGDFNVRPQLKEAVNKVLH